MIGRRLSLPRPMRAGAKEFRMLRAPEGECGGVASPCSVSADKTACAGLPVPAARICRELQELPSSIHTLVCSLARAAGLFTLVGLSLTGCMSQKLAPARNHFYAGRFAAAEQELSDIKPDEKDGILLLMERGIVRQSMRKYEDSSADLLAAVERERYLVTHSATETTSSFLANDKTISYRGPPFERTLLHTFLAKNYLSRGKWEDAAVEARSIIMDLQSLDGYPDDAYSRYMAGFCLELMRDFSNASLQYRYASNLVKSVAIDDRTGAIGAGVQNKRRERGSTELVCFVGIGHSPRGSAIYSGQPLSIPAPSYAEIYINGLLAGRSYNLTCVGDLLQKTLQKKAAMQAAKDVARIVVKETIAYQIKRENEAVGALAELVMLALESPDDRRWETLPMWLQVARIPCPPDLKSYDVVFKNASGRTLRRITVTEPIRRNDDTFVSWCRDLPPEQTPVPAPAKSTSK